MTDYNLIDRITAIRLELESETSNQYRILIAVRNILHQSDGLSYNAIRNILITYYNLNPNIGINSNIINLITSPDANVNNSINALLLNQYNNINNPTNNTSEDISDNNSDDESLSISNSSVSSEENNLEQPDNSEQPNVSYINPIHASVLPNTSFFFPNNSNINDINNPSYAFIQSLLTGTQNINNTQPTYHNMFNSLLSFSNSLDINLNDIEATNNIFPLFKWTL